MRSLDFSGTWFSAQAGLPGSPKEGSFSCHLAHSGAEQPTAHLSALHPDWSSESVAGGRKSESLG